jgi:negative regulator of sigma-B (phosphoserine phosphatase)
VSTQVSRPKTTTLVEWGVAVRAHPGESECGDRHVVRAFPDGVLLAVVDGLGHGQKAAAAARVAATVLEEHAGEAPRILVERCHEALAGSRGVVMSLASMDRTGSLSWLGVGNVEAVLVRPADGHARREERLLLRGGVVGFQLPALRAASLRVGPGDVLGLATDGVRSAFATSLAQDRAPQQLADEVLAEHGQTSDDALVLVARFVGAQP